MNWKAILHGVRIYGVFMGVFQFMPHKKNPRVFRERLNINGSWKMKWLLMTFSLPMNYTPGLLFMGKTETWPPWKFSLKLLSTVKSNTSLRICWLVNLKLYTCSNNPNPKNLMATDEVMKNYFARFIGHEMMFMVFSIDFHGIFTNLSFIEWA